MRFCKYHEKKLNLLQIHLHEVKILQIHNARHEFVKKKKKNYKVLLFNKSSLPGV